VNSGSFVMRRRDFIALSGSLACLWPDGAKSQQVEGIRRVGVLMSLGPEDPQGQARQAVFKQALQRKGWAEDHNVKFDFRWAPGNAELAIKYAAELVAGAPDVIVAGGGPLVALLQRATRRIPIVFTLAIDPIARGYVPNLSRPGGNTTGFLTIEYEFAAKWLELLKQIAPNVLRAAILRDPGAIGAGQYEALKSRAPSLNVEVNPIEIRGADEIERAVLKFSEQENSGLVITASAAATLNHQLIISLASRCRLPAVYPNRFHVAAGGLISYGPLFLDQYRQAADYVDRILKGAHPGDLPVQAPSRYESVLNLKTAMALNLKIPPIVLIRLDEIID
jgi:ABC-type uncharacterized transport system substrate-binding protein